MPLLRLGDDLQSATVPCTPGTSYPRPGQGPVEVGLLHRPTLLDPGTQHQFSNSHLYVAGTAHSHLLMAPTSGPLGKSVKLSFCPFCTYLWGNNLSYLNHIIIVHYNTSYGCGKCLRQAFMSSSALHNHKKVCLGLWQQAQQWWRR